MSSLLGWSNPSWNPPAVQLFWCSSFNTTNLSIRPKYVLSLNVVWILVPPFPTSSLTPTFNQHSMCPTRHESVLIWDLPSHIEWVMAEPTKNTSLHLVCKGIHCQQGDDQKTRIPITINLSRVLKESLRTSPFIPC